MASQVPQFIAKLYKLANAPQTASHIAWSDDGASFWVVNVEAFSRDVLPVYFKHNNYASFVRQLNMYGFHRSTEPKGKVEPGVTLVERFSHPMFVKGREDLVANIHRKNTTTVTKRVKTEELDANTPLSTPPVPETSPVDYLPVTLAQMQDRMERLEMQNASLIAQAAQQQEVINHLIHIMARNSLLAETDLRFPPRDARGMPAAAPRPQAASKPPTLSKPWDPASPSDFQMLVEDEDVFSSMLLNSLDLPAMDPPMVA